MYETWICDELGYKLYRCSDLSEEKVEELLTEHPEWQRKTICVE